MISSWIKNIYKFFDKQYPNRLLWDIFIVAFGCAFYFSLINEPKLSTPWLIALLSGIILMFKQTNICYRICLCFLFGFTYTATFTQFISTPQLSYPLRNQSIQAIVKNIEYESNKTTLLLQTNSIDLGDTTSKSTLVRVSAQNNIILPKINDKILANVSIYPPAKMEAPESFDFARWAYFNKISGIGKLNNYTLLQQSETNNFQTIRNYIHTKTNSWLVDTLVLGYKNAISKSDRSIWQTNGISHVWSISGFHIGLIGGWLFIIFYSIFRLIPPITKNVPAKIPAMIFSLIGLFVYLMLSGAGVATIRAFLMAVLVLLALINNRNIISLRNIGLVFLIILLINPFYVMNAGFQLSFAAVFGIVWFWTNNKTPTNKILKYFYTIFMTTFIATIFTLPFIITHFNSFPIYGLIGNILLLPIFSLCIMPLIIIGTITSMFGILFPLEYADMLYNFILQIAKHVTDYPMANLQTLHIPNIATCCFIFGLLCLMLLNVSKKYTSYICAGLFIICGYLLIILQPTPILFVTTDHELIGFNDTDQIYFNKAKAANHFFAFDTWKKLTNHQSQQLNPRLKHEHGVYTLTTNNYKIIYIQKFVPLMNNLSKICNDNNTDFIISYYNINTSKCNHKILHGGFIMYNSGKISITPDSRPWHHNQHR